MPQMEQKLNEIHDTVKQIDLAIKGDPARGVKGIVQHIEDFDKKILDHNIRFGNGNQQFIDLAEQLSTLKKTQEKNSSFMKGALWVMGILVTILNLIIAFIR